MFDKDAVAFYLEWGWNIFKAWWYWFIIPPAIIIWLLLR